MWNVDGARRLRPASPSVLLWVLLVWLKVHVVTEMKPLSCFYLKLGWMDESVPMQEEDLLGSTQLLARSSHLPEVCENNAAQNSLMWEHTARFHS